ncbi:dehydrogenase-like protein [Trypanosoma grayi]|uniref:dehydrogenase-like protein n=1 Tax=Trypanosoma grayi TaxID=71804 RepID=UPI0004F3FB96|nr:dehydrogenase-like protein [Trypanosoma grayi]KEG12920.1 dehydrogenase-like protein [Trypanosoma grayi]
MLQIGSVFLPLQGWRLTEIVAGTTHVILLLVLSGMLLITWPFVLSFKGVMLFTFYVAGMLHFQRRLASGLPLTYTLKSWRASKTNFRFTSSFVKQIFEKELPPFPSADAREKMRSGSRPVVVITGGERGIGYEVVKQLALLHFDLFVCCPSVPAAGRAITRIRRVVAKNACDSLSPGKIVPLQLDLSNEASVRRCASDILAATSRIDVLINNAGILHTGSTRVTNLRGDELVLAVNFIGPALFTELLLDTIKQSRPSRIVNVSSLMQLSACIPPEYSPLTILMENCSPMPWVVTKNYSLSKLLVVCYTRDLAVRLHDSGVNVSCLHPGVVFSHIYDGLGFWVKVMPYLMRTVFRFRGEGAEVVLHNVLADGVENGSFYADRKNFDSVVSPWARDPKMNAKITLWVREHFGLN